MAGLAVADDEYDGHSQPVVEEFKLNEFAGCNSQSGRRWCVCNFDCALVQKVLRRSCIHNELKRATRSNLWFIKKDDPRLGSWCYWINYKVALPSGVFSLFGVCWFCAAGGPPSSPERRRRVSSSIIYYRSTYSPPCLRYTENHPSQELFSVSKRFVKGCHRRHHHFYMLTYHPHGDKRDRVTVNIIRDMRILAIIHFFQGFWSL